MAASEAKDDSKNRVGYFSHAVERKDLKPGDHIYYKSLHRDAYDHHGIYTGDELGDAEVIYFCGCEVLSSSLGEFLDGNQLRLVAYGVSAVGNFLKRDGTTYVEESRPAKVVLETAKECLNDPLKLNVGIGDDRTFAAYCKTGKIFEGKRFEDD
jgi:hypothetical protein